MSLRRQDNFADSFPKNFRTILTFKKTNLTIQWLKNFELLLTMRSLMHVGNCADNFWTLLWTGFYFQSKEQYQT